MCEYILRVCIYFKRAKAKRIIAWRRSFLFVSKRHRRDFFSHEAAVFLDERRQDPNEPNSKEESFVRNRSSSSDIENERYAHTVLLRAHNTRARVE